jgi:dTDP-4-amino-4,6-dideoxygalactose transaminase
MSEYFYNSWPLGKLPEAFQRPEPAEILKAGYSWDDPRDIIDLFEAKLATYSGAKFAVATDSCSNGLFLALKCAQVSGSVEIPKRTYVSVPMQILHAGATPIFVDKEWAGLYQLGSSRVFDSAGRFTKDMFVGGDSLQVLSFQIKKRLPIGRGGAILTDSAEAYRWLKRASYDGRDLKSKYDSENHVQELGWHFYMTPEDAARGILLMDMLDEHNEDTMTSSSYPDLSMYSVFNKPELNHKK